MKYIMNYKTMFLVACSLMFFSCKTAKTTKDTPVSTEKNTKKEKESTKLDKIYYTEQIRNDFRAVSESTQYDFLVAYKATEPRYSILFFTQGFNGEEITVKNDNGTLFKNKVVTNEQTGLAKNMRIVNTSITSIYDKATRKTIYISTEKAGKHKFIYVMKGNPDDEKPYKITYSDKLRPER